MLPQLLTFGRLRRGGSVDAALLFTSLACSAVYLGTQRWQPFPGSVVIKALSIAPLAVLAFRLLREQDEQARGLQRLRDHDSLILAAALGLSCLGDIFLDLDPAGFFVHGLLAFLSAHLVYILLFVRNWQRPLRPTGWQLLLTALVLLYSLLLAHWLAPSLGGLARSVMFYVCVITVMVVTAIQAGFAKPWIVGGAILFMISDSLIAAQRFKTPLLFSNYLIWATYYSAQYGIAIGFLQEKLGAQSKR
jgi:uncharacterized membrane protein YhhN